MNIKSAPEWFRLADDCTPATMQHIAESIQELSLPLQVKFLPMQAHWFILDSLLLANQANRDGMHANALSLTRQCLEAVSIVELGLTAHNGAAEMLLRWERDKITAGALCAWLEANVWPSYGAGLWTEPWSEFIRQLAGAIQPYAHYTSRLAQWQAHLMGQHDPAEPDSMIVRFAPRAYSARLHGAYFILTNAGKRHFQRLDLEEIDARVPDMAPRSSDLKRLAFDAKAAAYVRLTGRTPMGDAIRTQREIDVCRQLHPDFPAMMKKLPRRTKGVIQEMCRRLGLTDPPKPWTAADRAHLRRLFPTATWEEILAAFPQRSRGAIVRVAYKWGLRRNRKPYKKTGHGALDQVRERCFELGFFMPDLDEWSNGKGYFAKLACQGRRPHMHKVERAAKAMGGKLVVEWRKESE